MVIIKKSELKKHNTASDGWIAYDGLVYNCTAYLIKHPGGKGILLNSFGSDCTTAFNNNGHSGHAKSLLKGLPFIGELESSNNNSKSAVITKEVESSSLLKPLSPYALDLKLIKKETINHDTIYLTLSSLNSNVNLHLNCGQHVKISAIIKGENVTRSYTPIKVSDCEIELLIKVYKDGILSSYLNSVPLNNNIYVEGPFGSFTYNGLGVSFLSSNRLPLISTFVIVAGGSGITPIFQVVQKVINTKNDQTKCILFYCNKNEEDILLKRELLSYQEKNKNINIIHILSQEKNKTNRNYFYGRISEDIIKKYVAVEESPPDQVRVLLCGPQGMMDTSQSVLTSMGFHSFTIFEDAYKKIGISSNKNKGNNEKVDKVEKKVEKVEKKVERVVENKEQKFLNGTNKKVLPIKTEEEENSAIIGQITVKNGNNNDKLLSPYTAKLKMSTSARELEDLQLKGKTCRIFIGTWGKGDVEKEDLISSFSRHGTIVEEIVYKPNFSFIQLATPEEAIRCVDFMNGTALGKVQSIKVSYAQERKKPLKSDNVDGLRREFSGGDRDRRDFDRRDFDRRPRSRTPPRRDDRRRSRSRSRDRDYRRSPPRDYNRRSPPRDGRDRRDYYPPPSQRDFAPPHVQDYRDERDSRTYDPFAPPPLHDSYDSRDDDRRGRKRSPSPPAHEVPVRILLLGVQQQNYCNYVVTQLNNNQIQVDVENLNKRKVSEAFADFAKDGVKVCCIVGRENEKNRTASLKFLPSSGKDMAEVNMTDLILKLEKYRKIPPPNFNSFPGQFNPNPSFTGPSNFQTAVAPSTNYNIPSSSNFNTGYSLPPSAPDTSSLSALSQLLTSLTRAPASTPSFDPRTAAPPSSSFDPRAHPTSSASSFDPRSTSSFDTRGGPQMNNPFDPRASASSFDPRAAPASSFDPRTHPSSSTAYGGASSSSFDPRAPPSASSSFDPRAHPSSSTAYGGASSSSFDPRAPPSTSSFDPRGGPQMNNFDPRNSHNPPSSSNPLMQDPRGQQMNNFDPRNNPPSNKRGPFKMMCRFMQSTGNCERGMACTFGHNESELVSNQQHLMGNVMGAHHAVPFDPRFS